MLTIELKRKCEDKVLETYMLAQRLFNRTFEVCGLEFTVGGKRVGGYADLNHNRINLNPHFFKFQSNIDNIINVVIPHEIAHLIDYKMNPGAKQAHGPSWKETMCKLGLPPDPYHYMEGSKEKKSRPKPYVYECLGCKKTFNLTSNLHTKIRRGQYRICKTCGTRVVFRYQVGVTIPAT